MHRPDRCVACGEMQPLCVGEHSVKLYGYWRSAATYRVRVALALKGLSAEEVAIDLDAGDQDDTEFRALNQQGAVPAIVLDAPGAAAIPNPNRSAIQGGGGRSTGGMSQT